MATSSSTNFSQTTAGIIKDALMLLGVVHEDETVHESTNNACRRSLNRMVKHWQNHGIKLHTEKEAVLLFDNDIVKYTFPDSALAGGDNGIINESVLTQTTLSADEASGQTILSVTSSTGMTATDKIIIELDSGERDETTIASVDSSTQITVDVATTGAAASGNHIYTFPAAATHANLVYPRSIRDPRIRDSDGNDRPLTMYSRSDYNAIADKDMESSPTAVFFDRQRANAVLYIWPEPDDLKETLRFTYDRALEDLDAFTDDLDFPSEYLDALVYNLAERVAPMFGKEAKLERIGPMAAALLQSTMDADQEDVEVDVIPDLGFE